jgi:hypothetical protein
MESPTPSEAPELLQHPDLRSELFHDLAIGFASELDSKDSLPAAARKALVELLDSDAPTAAEIIAAASKSDPLKKKAGDE